MNPNSHDEIHATGDQVPTQIHDAINQAEQTTDESLDWPEEVFKSAPAKLADGDNVMVKVKNPMTGKIEKQTCKVYSSHQHADGRWTYKLFNGPGTPFVQNWTISEYFEETRLKKVVPNRHAG
ncbi:hypothetical protein KC340_g11483 [Hortaea werneckii]|nr:hypothetical protein KC342_g17496 [Hortaea werneckii]KAI7081436.1 hypothetical protein KC339_g13329 [Hortaea werneckii]KAI7213918.1 hypothetical protein KC365_g14106 [Hortaea werneckii]KAI7307263.1 hypothetical protein KC340_g11483 [Hortaea werneckii]KAI7389308.1 hypothetical protein KC328_g8506 [Hortaea werneckii]